MLPNKEKINLIRGEGMLQKTAEVLRVNYTKSIKIIASLR